MIDELRQAEHWFGLNVRDLRRKAGMSQADLAAELEKYGYKIHQVTVGKLEHAIRPTRVGEVVALTMIFDVELADLFAPRDPCGRCGDQPLEGFTCNLCGRTA